MEITLRLYKRASLPDGCCPFNCLQVRSISEEMGIAFLGVGFDPKWRYEDVPRMPKARCVLIMACDACGVQILVAIAR